MLQLNRRNAALQQTSNILANDPSIKICKFDKGRGRILNEYFFDDATSHQNRQLIKYSCDRAKHVSTEGQFFKKDVVLQF